MTAEAFQLICIATLMFGGLLTATEPLHELKARKDKKATPRTIKGRSRRGRLTRKSSKMVKGLAGNKKTGKAAPLSDFEDRLLIDYFFKRDFKTA